MGLGCLSSNQMVISGRGNSVAGIFLLFGLTMALWSTPQRADADVLVRQDAVLTPSDRATGMPTSPLAGRQIERVVVGIETYGQGTPTPSYFLDAKVTLAGQPSGDPDAELNLGFGSFDGTVCVLNALLSKETDDYSGSSYGFVGYNPDYFPTPDKPWNCVAAFLDNSFNGSPATATYDALVGRFKDTRRKPNLRIQRVSLLGQKVGNLKLVRGVPTRIEVNFRNGGEVGTGPLVIRASGRGLKASRHKTRKLESDRNRSEFLTVRITGRQKNSRLRIVVGDGNSKATRTVPVTRVRPPKPPRSGKYKDKSAQVRFTVRNRRIVGWVGTMTTRCGGYPGFFHYSTNSYSHPTVKIPRNGIVQSSDRRKLFSTHLRLRIAGGKVTRGYFSYSGPDRCFASVNFNAQPG